MTRPGTTLAEAAKLAEDCVHCGFCLPDCPTYGELGREMDSPRGRIHLIDALARGRIEPTRTALSHLDLCLDCRACESACPSGVRYGRILESARAALERSRRRGPLARLARRAGLAVPSRPRALAAAARALRLLHATGLPRLAVAAARRRLAPGGLGRLAALVPAPRRGRFRARPGTTLPRAPGTPDRGPVALFAGCVMPPLLPQVHAATARLLRDTGHDVEIPAGQTCCGALHLHAGDAAGARTLALRNAAAFDGGEGPVAVNAAGCGAVLREYETLCPGDERAARLARRAADLTELLARDLEAIPAFPPRPARAVWDAPCHLLHAQRIVEAPLRLLARVPELELLPLPEADRCCGAAGSYALAQPRMAWRLLERKLDRIERSGADLVITANPGCQLWLEAGLRWRGSAPRVRHIAELLAAPAPVAHQPR